MNLDNSKEDLFEQTIQSVIDTIDYYIMGYTITDMKNDILNNVNKLFFDYNPDAKRYNIVGDMDGKPMKYCSNLCKPIANIKLKILNNDFFELWKNFRIEEQ